MIYLTEHEHNNLAKVVESFCESMCQEDSPTDCDTCSVHRLFCCCHVLTFRDFYEDFMALTKEEFRKENPEVSEEMYEAFNKDYEEVYG